MEIWPIYKNKYLMYIYRNNNTPDYFYVYYYRNNFNEFLFIIYETESYVGLDKERKSVTLRSRHSRDFSARK